MACTQSVGNGVSSPVLTAVRIDKMVDRRIKACLSGATQGSLSTLPKNKIKALMHACIEDAIAARLNAILTP